MSATDLPILSPIEIKALRHGLDLSQSEFSSRFGVPIAALRNWEQGRRQPDPTANTYLHLVAFNPDGAASVLQYLAEKARSGQR
jgi:putative transcriptional regulator